MTDQIGIEDFKVGSRIRLNGKKGTIKGFYRSITREPCAVIHFDGDDELFESGVSINRLEHVFSEDGD